jgi:hypothetical protein
VENLSARLVEDILESIFGLIRGVVSLVEVLSKMASEHFGPYGLLAFYLVGMVVVFLAIYGIVHFIFRILRYLVLPAVILAALLTIFLPYSFTTLLPISAAGCTLILLFKG